MFKIYCVFRDKLRASAQNLIVHRVWREHAISNVYGITAFAVGWRLSENNYGAHWILPYREPGHHEMRHAFAIVDCRQIIAMSLFRQMLPKQWCVWLPHGIFVSIESIHCGIVRVRASHPSALNGLQKYMFSICRKSFGFPGLFLHVVSDGRRHDFTISRLCVKWP